MEPQHDANDTDVDPIGALGSSSGPTQPDEPPGVEADGIVDDTGESPDTDGDDFLFDGCLIGDNEIEDTEGDPDLFAYVWQCSGAWNVRIYEIAGAVPEANPPTEGIPFGSGTPGDNPEDPTVMACCDHYDTPPPIQPHVFACYKDLAEQLCLHVATVLELRLHNGSPDHKTALIEWVKSAEGQASCMAVLGREADELVEEADPAVADGWAAPEPLPIFSTPPDFPISEPIDPNEAVWFIPDEFLDESEEPPEPFDAPWFDEYEGVTIQFFGVITGIDTAPVLDDLTCVDNDANNKTPLPSAGMELQQDADYVLGLTEGDAVLVGPTYDENSVAANVELASQDTSCEGECSQMWFSEDSGDWTVHKLLWFGGATEATDGGLISVPVDWVSIELAAPVAATTLSTNDFEIPAGDALFVVAGEAEGEPYRGVAKNSSAIRIRKNSSGVWQNRSFALRFVDDDTDSWLLTVALANWEPDPV